MANVFYFSDLHLGEKGILKYRPQFKTIEEHDETIIQNWNNTVTKRDLVWVLGDLGNVAVYDRLRGQKNVVLGNHDLAMPRELIKRFHKIHGASMRVNISGYGIICTHIPIHPQEFYSREFNLHGHTHDKKILLPDGNQDLRYVPVCCEDTDFTPLSREDLVEQLQCRRELIQEDPKTYPPFTRNR